MGAGTRQRRAKGLSPARAICENKGGPLEREEKLQFVKKANRRKGTLRWSSVPTEPLLGTKNVEKKKSKEEEKKCVARALSTSKSEKRQLRKGGERGGTTWKKKHTESKNGKNRSLPSREKSPGRGGRTTTERGVSLEEGFQGKKHHGSLTGTISLIRCLTGEEEESEGERGRP